MEIGDDASIVKGIFDEMKNNCLTMETRNIQFRKNALKSLLRGYKQMIPKIDEALKKDIGTNQFMNKLLSHTATINDIQEAIDNLSSWAKPKSVNTPIMAGLGSSCIEYEPLGLVLVISAWNYQIVTGIPPAVAAIAAGNSVILKPSEMAPASSNVLKELFDKFMDKKYYRVVEGKVQVAKAISKLPFDMICFTGSTTTGRHVAMEAAKNLTPCLLQLGGKCPIIVDETANIQVSVPRILMGKYTNCGQTCIGVDHVYVHESVIQKFKIELLKKVAEMYGSDNLAEEGFYGKIINEIHMKRLESYLSDKHGGKILYGGHTNKDKLYISPTIIECPSNESLMMKDEIFGPILPILPYNNIHEVVNQINARPKPLSIYLFSENKNNIKLIRHNTSSGSFVVNDAVMQKLNSQLPFGGVGHSGHGRYHSKAGFISFSNQKSIFLSKASNMFPASERFMPYSEKRMKNLNFLMKIGNYNMSQIGKCCLFFLVLIMVLVGTGLAIGMTSQ